MMNIKMKGLMKMKMKRLKKMMMTSSKKNPDSDDSREYEKWKSALHHQYWLLP